MWLTRFAINSRVSAAMVIMGLMIMGIVGLSRMPWEERPDVDIPTISIIVPYPGAGPEEIEQLILRPLEDEVSVINGVDEVEATGYENLASVAVSFELGTDVDVAAADVRDALARARGRFPDDIEEPSVYKIDLGALPVLTMGFSADRSPRDLRKLVDDEIRPRLGQVSGVASVTVTGGEEREIQVRAYKARLDAVGLSIADLAAMLRAESVDVPSGSIKEGNRDYAVRVIGEFKDLQEIRDLKLKTPMGGLMPLSSFAEIRDTTAEPDQYARLDGQPTVRVSVIKQSGSNTVAVVKGAREELEMLVGPLDDQGTGELPGDVKVVVSEDSSERVIESVLDVRNAIIYGALLAALVVFFTLNNFRGTIIVALAIPTAIISSFLPTGLLYGFTLNTMVMLALALAVGVLVDDSIVILENIDRHLKKGESPRAAALNGRAELASANMSTTLTDVAVYVPVAMMGGIVGQFFRPFGLTAATVSMFSLFMAFTLTPMLASWWYQRVDTSRPPTRGFWASFFRVTDLAYEALEAVYKPLLGITVRHPYLTVIVGYALMFLVLLSVRLPFEFFPSQDEGNVTISLETAVGTRLETTDALTREIENRLMDKQRYPSIEHITSIVGSQGGGLFGAGAVGGQYGQVYVTMLPLGERREKGLPSDEELVVKLREDLRDLPDVIIKVTKAGGPGGSGADIELNVLCEDDDLLAEASTKFMHEVEKLDGFLYVDLSAKAGRPEIHADIDRQRASDIGFSVAQVGQTVRAAFEGDTRTKFRDAGDEYDVRVQLTEFDRSTVSDVAGLFIGLNKEDMPVRLRDVAHVYMSTGPSKVERYNRQRKVTLTASINRDIIRSGDAQTRVNEVVEKWRMPGVITRWTGSIKMQAESFQNMFQALLLAVILVYLVMAILYNSLLQPLNVMFTLPMAIVGALIALKITGSVVSVVAMVGIIMLMGLVGKNAILVVDYTNTLRARGMDRLSALLEAGPTRMKPVLMTTISTVLGMLPTALSRNEGSEWRAPMAWAVIGGLTFATVLSLVVVPSTYTIWDQVEVFSGRISRGLGRLLGFSRKGDSDGPGAPPPAPGAPPPAAPVGQLPAVDPAARVEAPKPSLPPPVGAEGLPDNLPPGAMRWVRPRRALPGPHERPTPRRGPRMPGDTNFR